MIRLLWDPSAQPVRRSSYGILYIYDGGVPKRQLLERTALDIGFTDYVPASDEVKFHFILERGRSEGESLLVLLGARAVFESDANAGVADPGFDSVEH